MDEQQAPSARARRPSARDAKRAVRAAQAGHSIPYITRKIPCYEVLDEEGLALIERNADTILEEIGIEFREDPEALSVLKAGGCDASGMPAEGKLVASKLGYYIRPGIHSMTSGDWTVFLDFADRHLPAR